jgi:hypothetical protein
MRGVVADKTPARFPAPDVLTTRQPRMLQLADELPPTPEQLRERARVIGEEFSSDSESSFDGSIVTVPGGGAVNRPSTTIGGGGGGSQPTVTQPTIVAEEEEEEDDTPRTTRTTRPPRPRDLTTLPGP